MAEPEERLVEALTRGFPERIERPMPDATVTLPRSLVEKVEEDATPVFALARDREGTCRSCGVPSPVMHDPNCIWGKFSAALKALKDASG